MERELIRLMLDASLSDVERARATGLRGRHFESGPLGDIWDGAWTLVADLPSLSPALTPFEAIVSAEPARVRTLQIEMPLLFEIAGEHARLPWAALPHMALHVLSAAHRRHAIAIANEIERLANAGDLERALVHARQFVEHMEFKRDGMS